MDIIANWREGMKRHDKKVFDHEAAVAKVNDILDEIKKQVHIEKARNLLTPIRHWCKEGDKSLEAKHWQILAEYAHDQVKALTAQEDKSIKTFAGAMKDISTTLDGDLLKTVIERAEKRHGYGIKA